MNELKKPAKLDYPEDIGLYVEQETAKLREVNAGLVEALKNLVFTASKLWDEVKIIKDTQAMKVTHPMIEQAKQALSAAEAEK